VSAVLIARARRSHTTSAAPTARPATSAAVVGNQARGGIIRSAAAAHAHTRFAHESGRKRALRNRPAPSESPARPTDLLIYYLAGDSSINMSRDRIESLSATAAWRLHRPLLSSAVM